MNNLKINFSSSRHPKHRNPAQVMLRIRKTSKKIKNK